MFTLGITFQTYEELIAHTETMSQFKKCQEKKSQKSGISEMRGGHMRELHQRAKTFQEANPSMTYKECLKEVSKKI